MLTRCDASGNPMRPSAVQGRLPDAEAMTGVDGLVEITAEVFGM